MSEQITNTTPAAGPAASITADPWPSRAVDLWQDWLDAPDLEPGERPLFWEVPAARVQAPGRPPWWQRAPACRRLQWLLRRGDLVVLLGMAAFFVFPLAGMFGLPRIGLPAPVGFVGGAVVGIALAILGMSVDDLGPRFTWHLVTDRRVLRIRAGVVQEQARLEALRRLVAAVGGVIPAGAAGGETPLGDPEAILAAARLVGALGGGPGPAASSTGIQGAAKSPPPPAAPLP